MKLLCASTIFLVFLYVSMTSANLDVLYKRLTSINGRVVSTSRIRHLINIALCGLGCENGKKCYQYVYQNGLCYYITPMEDDLKQTELTPEEKSLLKQGTNRQGGPSLVVDAPPISVEGQMVESAMTGSKKDAPFDMASCEGKGYSIVGGKYCMKIFAELQKWTKADEQCKQDGGTLVTIKPQEKFKLLQEFIKEKGVKQVGDKQVIFVGANDRKKENDWRWSDGSVIESGAMAWLPGEPNNYQDEDCGAISMDWSYLMIDESCNNHRPFICEIY